MQMQLQPQIERRIYTDKFNTGVISKQIFTKS